jgi:hypothetical protein
MDWEYKVYPLPTNLAASRKRGQSPEEAVAQILQELLNTHAGQGWEYFRAETLYVSELPGCLGGMFGKSSSAASYNFLIFRRTSGPGISNQS